MIIHIASRFLAVPVSNFVRLYVLDVLIWGGPQRMLEHCVRGVKMGTTPHFLRKTIGDARLNFTYVLFVRHAYTYATTTTTIYACIHCLITIDSDLHRIYWAKKKNSAAINIGWTKAKCPIMHLSMFVYPCIINLFILQHRLQSHVHRVMSQNHINTSSYTIQVS